MLYSCSMSVIEIFILKRAKLLQGKITENLSLSIDGVQSCIEKINIK